MNKSMYFLIPAILIVLGLVGYSTFGKSNSETLPPAGASAPHDDSGQAPHED